MCVKDTLVNGFKDYHIILIFQILVMIVIFLKMSDRKAFLMSGKHVSIVNQFVVIVTIIASFLIAAIYRCLLDCRSVPVTAVCMLVAMLLVIVIYSIKSITAFWHKRKLGKHDRGAILEIILFLSVILLRIPLFNYIQRYDAGIYWGAIYECAKNFDFSLLFIWNNFKIWGHPSIMFTFFSIIGEFFTLGNSIGYCTINTIMSAFAVVCIYRICFYKLNVDKAVALSLCIVLQCVPIFWGTFSHVNPDYMILIFFIYMWYAHVFGEYILCMFWMFCLLQTKETGSIIVFGYAVSYFIYILESIKDNIKSRLSRIIKNPFMLICIINAIILLASFMIQGDVITWQLPDKESHSWIVGHSVIQKLGTDVNAFGIYPKYILCKLIHMFSLNFSWMATLGIFLCLLYLAKHHGILDIEWNVLAPLIGAFAFFAVFNLLYITYALYRYNVFPVMVLWLMALLLIVKVIDKRRLIVICNIGLLSILFVQTFFNADIISEVMFNKYPTGKGYLVATDMKKVMYGDNIVNNYKYSYIDELLDQMLKNIDYTSDTVVVYDDKDSINRLDIWARDSIAGWELKAGWNNKRLRREVLDNTNMTISPIRTMPYSEIVNNSKLDSDKYLLYFFEFSDLKATDVKCDLPNDCAIELEETISNWGGKLHYILVSRKQS